MKIVIGDSRVVWEGAFNQMREIDFIGIDGESNVWEMIERKTYGPVAVIIPVTTNNEIIFIKHFRIPRGGYVIETPAGIMDKSGESVSSLALRELEEETGYQAGSLIPVGVGSNNSGLQNEDCHFFVALDCVKVGEPAHESAEDIEIFTIPVAEVEEYLANANDEIIAAPLFGIGYFLRKAGVKW